MPNNLTPKGIPFTSQICVFSRVIFQQAAAACATQTKPVYRDNFFDREQSANWRKRAFSPKNSPGCCGGLAAALTGASFCADTEMTTLCSSSHWMTTLTWGLCLASFLCGDQICFKSIVLGTALSCAFLSKFSYQHSYPEQGLIPRDTGSQSLNGTRQGWSHSPVYSVWLSGGGVFEGRVAGKPHWNHLLQAGGGVASLWPRGSFSFVLSGTARRPAVHETS